jgi:hypothetical protein
MRFFFYGTLVDPALRRAVLGRMARRLAPVPARLEEFEARLAAGRRYPLVVRRRGAVLPGILMDLPGRAAARISAYEGPEYRRVRRTVGTGAGRSVSAEIFLPIARARASRVKWDLDLWRVGSRRRRRSFHRARRGGAGSSANGEFVS